jgi:hypothetical protein
VNSTAPEVSIAARLPIGHQDGAANHPKTYRYQVTSHGRLAIAILTIRRTNIALLKQGGRGKSSWHAKKGMDSSPNCELEHSLSKM